MKTSEDFINWLEEQPGSLSDGIYKNNTNAALAGRVIDLYKADKGISKKKTTKSSKGDAAASVTRQARKELSVKDAKDEGLEGFRNRPHEAVGIREARS